MSIKAKQVAGVTTLVVVVVVVLSAYHLATLARISLQETRARGEMFADALFQQARVVVAANPDNPYGALHEDPGLRATLLSTLLSPNVLYAAIANPHGVIVAHEPATLDPATLDPALQPQRKLPEIIDAGPIDQLFAVYSDRTFEVQQAMMAGDENFGMVRIGVSTVLVRKELEDAQKRAAGTIVLALVVATLVSMVLAQWMLRPIHVIQSGLTRLGRGELDVRLDLPGQEFKDLGSSFEAVSAQLSALGRAGSQDGAARPGASTDLQSVMENLEDAVALFSPGGELIFCNSAMNALVPAAYKDLASDHPVREIVERTLAGRKSYGPISVNLEHPSPGPEAAAASQGSVAEPPAERLLMSHAIHDNTGRFVGAMLVARNIGYLSQVQSTLNYSRKLAALGRLMAGVAHEVKNPLNAMTIHLELLKQKLAKQQPTPVVAAVGAAAGDARAPESRNPATDLSKHVKIISDEIRRLDQVVVGFLKFARPEELKLQPVKLSSVISDVATSVAPECEGRGIALKTECPSGLPEINADLSMLRQALLNLALNGCQAMPDGGTLRLACRTAARRQVEIDVEDTGVGIAPEHLSRIFDLYFTTKEKGSGIGLSMVYRIVQLHDGDIEVQSTPGHGTRFRLTFPQA